MKWNVENEEKERKIMCWSFFGFGPSKNFVFWFWSLHVWLIIHLPRLPCQLLPHHLQLATSTFL